MWDGLDFLFAKLGADPAVHVVVLTGAGTDFTAGADIAEFATIRDFAAQAREPELVRNSQ